VVKARRLVQGVASASALLLAAAASAVAAGVFAPTPSAQTSAGSTVRAIVYAGGNAYIGGTFTSVRPAGASSGTNEQPRAHIAAVNTATGALDPWNPGANGAVYSLAVANGILYVGGSFTTVDGQPRKNLAAFNLASGQLTSWAPKASMTVKVVRIGPNGNIFVGGSFGSVNNQPRSRLAEITPAGTLTSWSPSVGQVGGSTCPPRCPPQVLSMDFLGSTVYVGGEFGLMNGAPRNTVAAVRLDTGATLSWDPNIFSDRNCPQCPIPNETSRAYNVIATAGRIYVCGGFWKLNGLNANKKRFNVAAFNPTSGAVDSNFTAQDDGDTTGCALRGNVLFVGGHFNRAGPGCTPQFWSDPTVCATRHHVAAFDVTRNALLPWDPSANSNHGVTTIATDRTLTGSVGFGGFFTRIGRSAQEGFADYENQSHLP
jgi:hypothetical protein